MATVKAVEKSCQISRLHIPQLVVRRDQQLESDILENCILNDGVESSW